jgi:ADP-ribosylglycohydrolase
MGTIEPWLSEKYIRKVLLSEKDRVELIFLDGVRQVYLIDDCSKGEKKKMVDVMKRKGIPVVIETLPISKLSRCRGALQGLFIGDALAMPVHWYYDRLAMKRDYGYVTDYLPPKNPHPDSILWRSSYEPINEKGDILHDQARYWGKRGVHYHQLLEAGENTLNLKLSALLIHSINDQEKYDANDYLRRYISFMTTPGQHQDTYVEECHRRFFMNYANGMDPRHCGTEEKHIGGLAGIFPILIHYRDNPETALERALEHLSLTHRGARMESSASLISRLFLKVIHGEPVKDLLEQEIQDQKSPFLHHPFLKWLDKPDDWVVGRQFSTACYVEESIPAVIYLALKYHQDTEKALIVNTNLGGDNAYRGAVLGALLGGANGIESLPGRWLKGLKNPPPDLKSMPQHHLSEVTPC